MTEPRILTEDELSDLRARILLRVLTMTALKLDELVDESLRVGDIIILDLSGVTAFIDTAEYYKKENKLDG